MDDHKIASKGGWTMDIDTTTGWGEGANRDGSDLDRMHMHTMIAEAMSCVRELLNANKTPGSAGWCYSRADLQLLAEGK